MNKKECAWQKLVFMATFAFCAMFLLVGPYRNLLREIEAQSLFVPTEALWKWHMLLPGGLLNWIGSWFNQLFFHPWLGASVYVAMLLGLSYLAYKALALPKRWFGISLVPAAMLLLGVLTIGYSLFSFKSPAFAYSNLLGLAFALAVYWLWRNVKPLWLRALLAIVLPGLYPFLGFYSLMASGLCVLGEIAIAFIEARKNKGAPIDLGAAAVLGIAAIAIIPQFFYRYGSQLLPKADIYTSGLPIFFPNEANLWAPYWVAFAFVGVCILWRPWFKYDVEKPRGGVVMATVIFALALCSMFVFRFHDKNFMLTLDLRAAIDDNDWDKVLEIRKDYGDFEPTRVNVLYTDIALWRKGIGADQMFSFPNGSAPYESTRTGTVMRDIISQPICLHMGRVNTSYRWSMEYAVEYGFRVAYLKNMVLCALLMEEFPLAQKYIDTLKKTMWHKDWAEKYQAYVDNPRLMPEDPDMKSIHNFMYFRDHIGGDAGKLESYLMPLTAGLNGGTPELMSLTLQCNLVQKDIDKFMDKLPRALPTFPDGRMPRHFQEAVLLWSMIHNNQVYKQLRIDPEVMARWERFNQFVKAANAANNSGRPLEEKGELFKDAFGDTYWYYFFFNLGMKTK